MSDYEEDDLDILTSLLDEEDDEEEKLRKQIKTTSTSGSKFQKKYINKPPKASKEGKKEPTSDEWKETSVEIKITSGESSTANQELSTDIENSPDFDDEEDIDDLAALLEAEKDMDTEYTSQQESAQLNTSNTPSTSQAASQSSSAGSSMIKPDDPDDDDDKEEESVSPDKSDEEKSKAELLEELRQMKAAMADMKKAKQSPAESKTSIPDLKQAAKTKKEPKAKSPTREMFSDALAPKIESKKTKPAKSHSSKQGKDTGKLTSQDSINSSSDDGNQRKKKKHTMNAAAATQLFHSSQDEDDDQEMESSDESEEEEDKKPMMELFTKNKRRVAHTPTNQSIKPKKESPYQCRLCDKIFNDFTSYRTHEFKHRENPSNNCKVCKKVFSSGDELFSHMRIHKYSGSKESHKSSSASSAKSETPSRSHDTGQISNKCKLCGKKFSSRSGLQVHLRGEHGEEGEKEMARLNKLTIVAMPENPSSSSSSSNGYGMSYGRSSSSTKGKPGSKLLGDQRRMKGEDGQEFEVEKFSQIRIVNPVISSASMKEKMSGRKFLRLPVIKKSVGLGGDVEGDWATMAVLVSKIPPKTSSKGKVFSIWKINDLCNLKSTVALFLFGKVHEEHWKTVEGSVIGILNANIMPNRDSIQSDELSMTIDHPQKMLVLGRSKDLGFCKGKTKKGKQCTMIVNKSTCEHCEYHVQSEYKKVSAKRTDLQSTYSGPVPKKFNAMNQCMKNVIYQGKSFTTDSRPKMKATAQKKGMSGSSLGSATGVDKMMAEKRKDVILMHGKGRNEEDTVVKLANASDNFKDLLSNPTPGSQNLMRHMVDIETTKNQVQGMSAKELLIMQKDQLAERRAKQNQRKAATVSQAPRIQEDNDFTFFSENNRPKKSNSSGGGSRLAEIAKRKAMAMFKSKGPLTKQDPNRVGGSMESSEKTKEAVRKRVEKDLKERNGADSSPESNEEPEPQRKKRKLFLEDGETMSKERMTDIMNTKSKNAELLTEIEAEWQDKYFDQLEAKEKLETKMSEVMEKKCRVVSCKMCKYTWFVASQLCRDQGHQIKHHDAVQRYFNCKNCRVRTIAFDRIPTRPCRSCGSINYTRTSMLRERKGPTLESEKLLIRGEERKWVNS